MLSVAPQNGPDGQIQLRASTVVFNGQAIAFVGPSGVGKSGMALRCIAQGAQLLADDITWLYPNQGTVFAHCPPALSGKIEARGVGILNAIPHPPARLTLIVDLGVAEAKRAPDPKTTSIFGCDIPVFHKPENSYFVDAILHYVSHGAAK